MTDCAKCIIWTQSIVKINQKVLAYPENAQAIAQTFDKGLTKRSKEIKTFIVTERKTKKRSIF